MKNTSIKSIDLSDDKLLSLCKKYGTQTKLWRQKFLGLLPEVFQRKLYLKKNCTSIFEFAAKMGGVSEKQVRLVLNLQKRFTDKPKLQTLLINGQVSVNKLARVASIANTENQELLANQVQLLPQKALEVLVRDEKIAASKNINLATQEFNLNSQSHPQKIIQNGLFEAENQEKLLRTQRSELHISDSTVQELLDLQKLGIDIDALIKEKLHQRKVEIATEKEQISTNTKPAKSRYIPQQIKQIFQKEYGHKCSIQLCQKPSQEIHHTQRFALSKTHDPKFMAPLCHEHHLIAQSIDVQFHQVRQNL